MFSKAHETPTQLSIFYGPVEWLVYRYTQNHCNMSILWMLFRFYRVPYDTIALTKAMVKAITTMITAITVASKANQSNGNNNVIEIAIVEP